MKSHIVKARDWLASCTRALYPLMLCLLGGGLMQTGHGWLSLFLAGLAFAFAVDLAASRGEAKGKVDAVAMFIAPMVSGVDTTITVNINDATPPLPTQEG
jgi:hypothetical protein